MWVTLLASRDDLSVMAMGVCAAVRRETDDGPCNEHTPR